MEEYAVEADGEGESEPPPTQFPMLPLLRFAYEESRHGYRESFRGFLCLGSIYKYARRFNRHGHGHSFLMRERRGVGRGWNGNPNSNPNPNPKKQTVEYTVNGEEKGHTPFPFSGASCRLGFHGMPCHAMPCHAHGCMHACMDEWMDGWFHVTTSSMNHTCIRIRVCFKTFEYGKHPRSMMNTMLLYSLFIIR